MSHNYLHTDQLANQRMVAIAAGATGGGLVFMIVLLITLMAIIITVVLQKRRQKTINLTTNVAYTRRITDSEKFDNTYDIISGSNIEAQQSNGEMSTEQNIAYQPSAVPMSLNVAYTMKGTEESSQPTAAAELDMVYDIIEENTTEVRQSNGEAFGLSTERNVAYKQSTVPMSSNVAYKSQQGLVTDGDKDYDYIISTDQL